MISIVKKVPENRYVYENLRIFRYPSSCFKIVDTIFLYSQTANFSERDWERSRGDDDVRVASAICGWVSFAIGKTSRIPFAGSQSKKGQSCYAIALISRVALDRALFLPPANSCIHPAETARSVGIRDVTPYVPSLGIVGERGARAGQRGVSASADTWMHTGERRMR